MLVLGMPDNSIADEVRHFGVVGWALLFVPVIAVFGWPLRLSTKQPWTSRRRWLFLAIGLWLCAAPVAVTVIGLFLPMQQSDASGWKFYVMAALAYGQILAVLSFSYVGKGIRIACVLAAVVPMVSALFLLGCAAFRVLDAPP